VVKMGWQEGGCGKNVEVVWNEVVGLFFRAWKFRMEGEFWVFFWGCGKTGLQVVAGQGVMR